MGPRATQVWKEVLWELEGGLGLGCRACRHKDLSFIPETHLALLPILALPTAVAAHADISTHGSCRYRTSGDPVCQTTGTGLRSGACIQ